MIEIELIVENDAVAVSPHRKRELRRRNVEKREMGRKRGKKGGAVFSNMSDLVKIKVWRRVYCVRIMRPCLCCMGE